MLTFQVVVKRLELRSMHNHRKCKGLTLVQTIKNFDEAFKFKKVSVFNNYVEDPVYFNFILFPKLGFLYDGTYRWSKTISTANPGIVGILVY